MAISVPPGSIAVVDVETTGLFPSRNDRIVEVAAVIVHPDRSIGREFVSLVNPERDIGPTSVHGLTSEEVMRAPRFREIAGHLLDTFSGVVAIAGHNVRFDQQFLSSELYRIGFGVEEYPTLCTMQMAGGGNLAACCERYGVSIEGRTHSALVDARAAALLMRHLLEHHPQVREQLRTLSPIRWPSVPSSQTDPVTREGAHRAIASPPKYLDRLLARRHVGTTLVVDTGAASAYWGLLDRILEDRCVNDVESNLLLQMASDWGLSGEQIRRIHHDYVSSLTCAAAADGDISDVERTDLQRVARLLGHGPDELAALIAEVTANGADAQPTQVQSTTSTAIRPGSSVCFTGELQCTHKGLTISRELATEIAQQAGLRVTGSVTKKLDILVVADPHTQSVKATKARQYGIRIMHEAVFWKALGIEVT